MTSVSLGGSTVLARTQRNVQRLSLDFSTLDRLLFWPLSEETLLSYYNKLAGPIFGLRIIPTRAVPLTEHMTEQ